MLPEMCLLPHEVGDLVPGESLCAPANWRVKTLWLGGEYLVRAVEFKGDKRTLVARQQGRREAPLLRLNVSDLAVTLAGGDDLIVNDLRMNQFERRLAFDASGRLIKTIGQTQALLLVNFMGETFWANDAGARFRFVWRGFDRQHRFDEKWRAHATDARIEAEIGEMLACKTSDCAYAWRWLQLGSRARQASLYGVARGSLAQVEALLRAVCVSGAHELSGTNWRLRLNVAVGAGTEFYAGGATEIVRRSNLSCDEDYAQLSPQQFRLAEFILRYFELWRNWDAQIYTLVQEQWRHDSGCWEIPFSSPSMHDLLEARLLLRDWLQGKISPAELSELLA